MRVFVLLWRVSNGHEKKKKNECDGFTPVRVNMRISVLLVTKRHTHICLCTLAHPLIGSWVCKNTLAPIKTNIHKFSNGSHCVFDCMFVSSFCTLARFRSFICSFVCSLLAAQDIFIFENAVSVVVVGFISSVVVCFWLVRLHFVVVIAFIVVHYLFPFEMFSTQNHSRNSFWSLKHETVYTKYEMGFHLYLPSIQILWREIIDGIHYVRSENALVSLQICINRTNFYSRE